MTDEYGNHLNQAVSNYFKAKRNKKLYHILNKKDGLE